MVFIRPRAAGTRGAPGAALRLEAGAEEKNSSGALFSELLGSTVFIRPGAAGTRDALGAALRWEAGARAQRIRAGPGAALSREVGTGAAVTRSGPGAALRGPGDGNRSRGDTQHPRSCPASGGGCCPQSCPELVYCCLFLVIST
jgi:hypothetical protein